MCEKIIFNKIEQGFINIMSGLVIVKACKAMTSWNDNEVAENDNEPCGFGDQWVNWKCSHHGSATSE